MFILSFHVFVLVLFPEDKVKKRICVNSGKCFTGANLGISRGLIAFVVVHKALQCLIRQTAEVTDNVFCRLEEA